LVSVLVSDGGEGSAPSVRAARCWALAALLWAQGNLAGCATALSGDAMDLVSPEVAPVAVLADPERFVGKVILVAGPILKLDNRQEGTFLEILGYPTTARGFPDTSEPALGRFLLRYPVPLDRLDYRPGRSVAAVGRIEGTRPADPPPGLRPLLKTLELALLPEHPVYYEPILIGIGIMGGF
jgi:hypothetical protein